MASDDTNSSQVRTHCASHVFGGLDRRSVVRLKAFEISIANSPIVGAAIHDGHQVRDEIRERMRLDESGRFHEEDPHTRLWARCAPSHIVGCRSRFEFDLNRPPDKAVYSVPDDAWGLEVWNEPLPDTIVARSMELYDAFYREVHSTLSRLLETHLRLIVLDLHSYNHRRDGPDDPPADEAANPQVNIGTGTMDRAFWTPVIERLIGDLHSFDFQAPSHRGPLDVRENIKFQGGYFGRWIHENFPERVCAPAIEFKKFFMNEWTGEADWTTIDEIGRAIESTFPGLRAALV